MSKIYKVPHVSNLQPGCIFGQSFVKCLKPTFSASQLMICIEAHTGLCKSGIMYQTCIIIAVKLSTFMILFEKHNIGPKRGAIWSKFAPGTHLV